MRTRAEARTLGEKRGAFRAVLRWKNPSGTVSSTMWQPGGFQVHAYTELNTLQSRALRVLSTRAIGTDPFAVGLTTASCGPSCALPLPARASINKARMFSSGALRVASKSAIRRTRGHPSRWPVPSGSAASELPPPAPLFPVSPVQPAPSGFLPPTGKVPPGITFSVSRTPSLGIPVYTDFKNGRSRVITIVRKINGDAGALRDELSRVLGEDARVDLRVGRVEVDGNRVKEVKTWLAGLGF